MRNYLKEIEIVGTQLASREGQICRFSLDWLYANCDRVCIVLDNWDDITEAIALEYKKKYSEMTTLSYSKESIGLDRSDISSYTKAKFCKRHKEIREGVLYELKKMHEEKPIDLLIWPDADELFIDEIPKYLKDFWANDSFNFIMTGFVEVYDNFYFLTRRSMVPHGRIYKYIPELSWLPYAGLGRLNPYYKSGGGWKISHISIHLCQLTEEDRSRRWTYLGVKPCSPSRRLFWILPHDVRTMSRDEIMQYADIDEKAITLQDYIDNKDKYLSKHPLWKYN